jgi:hypothetical protein
MHNCERQLRSAVVDLLDLAPSIDRPLAVVVVDDGSTDETYETACELARSYPQVSVLRQSIRQGLGAALDLVRNRLSVEMVVVHDGISAIDAAQLQALLQSDSASAVERAVPPTTSTLESQGSRRFASIRTLHDRMEHAHRSAACFRWMYLEKPLVPRRCQIASVTPAQQPVLSVGAPVHLASLPMGINSAGQL